MIDTDIARAIQDWIAVQMHERRGPGKDRPDGYEGYSFADMLDVLDAVCPDAIARMLQAGASAYIAAPAGTDIVVGWRTGRRSAVRDPEGSAESGSQGTLDL